jgi:hypothetical protein
MFLLPKKQKYGFRYLEKDPFRVSDPGVEKEPDPGSATLES